MNITTHKSCSNLRKITEKFIGENPALANATRGIDLSVGPATDPMFQTPAHAQDAIFVGDSARIIGAEKTAEIEALFKVDPNKVSCKPVYDSAMQAWKYKFDKLITDSVSPIVGQSFSPWNVSFFQRVFREPLLYSHAREFVRIEQGNNPWAEVMTLILEQYAGFAVSSGTGSAQNTMVNDVNVQNGMMTGNVINISASYALTLEEQERDKRGGNPFAGQGMASKQKYTNYVINMLTDYLTYYGNGDIQGLFNVNPVINYSGSSLAEIAAGASATKGSDAYAALYKILNDFLTAGDNKFEEICVGMSPEAYNNLTSLPYSSNYNPTAAHKIFVDNYLAGKGKDGKTPTVKFFSDPLLKAGSIFNPSSSDYMVITAPEVKAGPSEESQPLVLFGAPMMDLVFPVIPGQYNTQYKTMRRVAGVFAPVPQAIRVYQGFGRK